MLIDDIQFIAGKKAVQEEFFHTFNAITREGGQVIMTSDKPPKEIDSLEERLRSRFEGGLTIDIGQPDFELRSAILIIKAGQMGMKLPTEVAQFVAERVEDTRALLGRLTTIVTLAKSRGVEPTVELAQELIDKFEGDKKQETRVVDPAEVVERVCEYYKASVEGVLGLSRVSTLTLPRHVAMYILKNDMQVSLVEIGKRFGGRDHSSVIHAVKKVMALVEKNNEVRGDVIKLKKELFG